MISLRWSWLWSLLWVLPCACKTEVVEAHCNACGPRAYSAEDCQRWGEQARCQRTEFIADIGGGCANGCRFEECDLSPMCVRPASPADDDAGDDEHDAGPSDER